MAQRSGKAHERHVNAALRPVLCLSAVALLLVAPATGAAQEGPPSPISGRCVGATEADEQALVATQLNAYRLDAAISIPAKMALGEPATASVALSFEVTDLLVMGAETLGIASADLTGSQFPVTLVTPTGSEQKVLTPPSPAVDMSASSRIDLGSADFSVPTDTPGAVQIRLDPSRLVVKTSPGDLAATSTCTAGSQRGLPVGFVTDPLAPVITPADETVIVDPDQARTTVDLNERVTASAGPILEESWRVVRTDAAGDSSATIDAGVLSIDSGQTPTEIVWEVCGLSETPEQTDGTTSTTSSVPDATTDDSDPDSVDTGAAEDPDEGATDDEAGPATEPTTHCAQGLLRLDLVGGAQVLGTGSSAEATGESVPVGGSSSSGTPLSVTG